MDTSRLIEILRCTTDPDLRVQAEQQLSQIVEITGFTPCLLQVVMRNDVPVHVRQASVIYFKNTITSCWRVIPDNIPGLPEPQAREPVTFRIHEQDCVIIRDLIVDAIVQAPDFIRVHLCISLKTIIEHDFPTRWTQIVDKIHIYLQNSEPSTCMAALLCLYELIKKYEFSSYENKKPLIEVMNFLLPMTYNLIVRLQTDDTANSLLIQKQILKCFFGLVKYILPLDLINKEIFTKWMEVLCAIIEKPVPEGTLAVDEDDRMELPWWKCKKWAVHTLQILFERYGSPLSVRPKYVQFSEWYLTTFTGGVLNVLLKVLDRYRNKIYVSPRVLELTLTYMDQCVCPAHSWKLLKPHMVTIIQDVLFPLMCHTDADEQLYSEDPQEYMQLIYGIFDDYNSPERAAQNLLTSSCKNRKDLLENAIQLCTLVLAGPVDYGSKQRYGTLYMVGILNEILLKKKKYKYEIDLFLRQNIFPQFNNPVGFVRARAFWVLQCFARVNFKNDQILVEAVMLTVNALLTDLDLPVKVQAAIAIRMLLTFQEKVFTYLEPRIIQITSELLNMIRENEVDNIATVLQKIVSLYTEQLMPMAYKITDNLVTNICKTIETDFRTDEKQIMAIGLLSTLNTVLGVMQDNPEIMGHSEKTVLRVIVDILRQHDREYYDDAMILLRSLTAKRISEVMWKVLGMIYQNFEKVGKEFFIDMMPVLYNYVTVDTPAFVSNENHILAIYNMCKLVLNAETEDQTELHAAKLLEVMVLKCNGKIDHCLPSFIDLVLNRLSKKVKTSGLRAMLLLVLIAILYCNPHLLFSIMDHLQGSGPNISITQYFIQQWIDDIEAFMGIHNRKLCIIGLCTLLEIGPQKPNLKEIISQLIPSILMLFDGLKRAYVKAIARADQNSSSDEEYGENKEVLSSDEDYVDDEDNCLSVAMTNNVVVKLEELENVLDSDEDFELVNAELECYTTPLDKQDCPVDEYIKFKNALEALSTSEPAIYHSLTSTLNDDQKSQLKEVIVVADQRSARKRSGQRRGYSFSVPAKVPTKFKF